MLLGFKNLAKEEKIFKRIMRKIFKKKRHEYRKEKL